MSSVGDERDTALRRVGLCLFLIPFSTKNRRIFRQLSHLYVLSDATTAQNLDPRFLKAATPAKMASRVLSILPIFEF